ncbi:hypothetical protein [Glycomyces sp. NPDC048151]|uniref:hypothetical protein n=1 Tax=Glycomyces sp. NPDC048151 TaxID=3364002 RepID=UPI003716E49E
MSESLADAVDRLYAAFESVPRPETIDRCDHCWTEQEAAAVLRPVPLRDLSADELRPYAASVLLTVGSVADFRYFLPRILEIACTDGFNWPDLEPLAGRLRDAEWETWTAEEQAAIRGVLWASWRQVLSGHPDNWGADTVLCAIGNAEDDLTPYLDEWAASLRRTAAANELRDLLQYSTSWRSEVPRLTNAFWDGRDAQVIEWLTGPALRAALAEARANAATRDAREPLVEVEAVFASRGR